MQNPENGAEPVCQLDLLSEVKAYVNDPDFEYKVLMLPEPDVSRQTLVLKEEEPSKENIFKGPINRFLNSSIRVVLVCSLVASLFGYEAFQYKQANKNTSKSMQTLPAPTSSPLRVVYQIKDLNVNPIPTVPNGCRTYRQEERDFMICDLITSDR